MSSITAQYEAEDDKILNKAKYEQEAKLEAMKKSVKMSYIVRGISEDKKSSI